MPIKTKKIFVWTDNDLDGASSALLLKWIYSNYDVVIEEAFETSFANKIKQTDLSKYDKVFIVDLYVPDEAYKLIDLPKVTIIDHHQTHIDVKDRYKKAKTIIELYSSAVKLIYDTYGKNVELTPAQKAIVVFGNDYDSYALKHKESLMYHAIHRAYNYPKVKRFVEAFDGGHRQFTPFEENAVKLYIKRYKEQLNTDVYVGKFKDYKIISCYATDAINEVAYHMLKKHNGDIVIVVNPTYQVVSFRKSKKCNAKLNVMAEKLCEGGGHDFAAGGKITEQFIEFTKILNKI